MEVSGTTDGEEPPREQDGRTGLPAPVEAAGAATEPGEAGRASESGQVLPPAGSRRAARLAACVAVAALALGAGFGIAKVVGSPGAPAISSAIPSPAKGNDPFIEDDNLTAQDNQTNILQTTAPGLVHIISAGKAVGIGMVLTPSGKVLTTYQPARGAGNLAAKYVVSGKTFKATLVGTDASAGLALLQLEGGDGRAFPTLAVGNSATLVSAAYHSEQFSYHVAGQVVDTAVGTSGTQGALSLDVGTLIDLNGAAVVDGKSRTGLLQSILQSVPVTEIGGPLVNLNGQAIGITVARAGSGLDISGFAMPINQALAIAARIDAQARPSS